MATMAPAKGGARVVAGAAVLVLLGSLAAGCEPSSPGISVTYSKTPARGTTTVTVTVTGFTVTKTKVRIDNTAATPIATSTAASFTFDLDTTRLSDGAHQLFV